MGYAEMIAHEAETLTTDKQIEILNFIAFLKTRNAFSAIQAQTKTAEDIETFFKSYNIDTSNYRFDRDDANAR
ncbi:MAG: hypothetical protein ACU837_08970 [Gammaproteobacteria bacterium]